MIVPKASVLFVNVTPSSMRVHRKIPPYTCPHCHHPQTDVWILEGYYLAQPESGWFEPHCPQCEQEFDPDFAETIGVFG